MPASRRRRATPPSAASSRAGPSWRCARRRKKGAGALVAFELAIDTVSTDQKFIHRELPRALSANELELHYQPIVAADGGAHRRRRGVAALDPCRRAARSAPAVFIPVAEQMGLMDTLGDFVLRRALAEAKRWPGSLRRGQPVAAAGARRCQSSIWCARRWPRAASPPSRLMLEITEGVLIDNPDEMVKRIEDLHALGVRIALDDFGSGYSNLGYLQRFPARQAQDRPQLRARARHIPPMAA